MLRELLEKYSFYSILVIAFFVRVLDLTKKDFWYDEAFTGIAVKSEWGAMLKMVIDDVHPPLYYISVKLFAWPFGYDVWSIRFFSLIFGILGIVAVYLLAKEIFDKRVALLATFITAISPFAIQYSQEGRMYTMFSFLIVFSTYWLVRALKTKAVKEYFLWGVFWGLACLTHYLGILFAPTFYGLFLLKRISERGDEVWWRLMFPQKGVMLGGLVALGVFSCWLGKFIEHLGRTNTLDWISPAHFSDIFLNLQMFLFGIPKGDYSGMPSPNAILGFDQLTMLLLITIFTIWIILFSTQREKREPIGNILLLSFGSILVLYALSLAGSHYLVVRYIMPSAYFFFILLGLWLAKVHWRLRGVSLIVYLILIVGIQPSSLPGGFGQVLKDSKKFEESNFYVLNSFDYVIAKYYFGHEKVVLYNVDWPEYDSSAWAAIGRDNLRKTTSFDDLKNDPKGLILYNTQVPWEKRSDKSFEESKFELIDQYDNILIYRSKPKIFFR